FSGGIYGFMLLFHRTTFKQGAPPDAGAPISEPAPPTEGGQPAWSDPLPMTPITPPPSYAPTYGAPMQAAPYVAPAQPYRSAPTDEQRYINELLRAQLIPFQISHRTEGADYYYYVLDK